MCIQFLKILSGYLFHLNTEDYSHLGALNILVFIIMFTLISFSFALIADVLPRKNHEGELFKCQNSLSH